MQTTLIIHQQQQVFLERAFSSRFATPMQSLEKVSNVYLQSSLNLIPKLRARADNPAEPRRNVCLYNDWMSRI